MESFVAFLRDNWKFLVEFFLLLVSFFVLCFLKKIKINIPSTVWTEMIESLPYWIRLAEGNYGSGNGQDKLKYVLKTAVLFLAEKLGLNEHLVLDSKGDEIIKLIEAILNTPQKKGDQ